MRYLSGKKNSYNILIFMCLVTTFTPMIFYYNEYLSVGLQILRILRGTLLLYLAIDCFKSGKIHKRIVAPILLFLVLYIITLSKTLSMTQFLDNVSVIMLLLLLIEKLEHVQYEDTVEIICRYFIFMLLINFILMLASPKGVHRVVFEKDVWHELSYAVHFLQTNNRLCEFIFPACVFSTILFEEKKISRVKGMLILLLCVITAWLSKSATTICGVIVFFTIYILFGKKTISSKWWLLPIGITLFQLVYAFIMTNDYVIMFTSIFFKEIGTIMSRARLLEQAFSTITENFLIGVGAGNVGRLFQEGNMRYWAHNTSIDILVQGGVIVYSIFLVMTAHIKNITHNYFFSTREKILFFASVMFAVVGMAESMVYAFEFYLVLFYCNATIWNWSFNESVKR